MRGVAIVLLGAAACEGVFGVGPINAYDGGPCTMLAISDDFTGAMPCGSWGTSYGGVTEGSGMLVFAVNAASNEAYCLAKMPIDFTAPLFVAVPTVPASGNGFVTVEAHSGDSTHVSAYMIAMSLGLAVADYSNPNTRASQPYDASRMLWWPLRPEPEGVYGEYSSDGHGWSVLGLAPGAVPQQVTIKIDVVGSADMAVLQHLDVCPP